MRNGVPLPFAMAVASLLAGCASLPDVTAGYFLTTSKVGFKVVRTVACDADNRPIMATTVTPAVVHSANRSERKPLRYADLKGPFSDTDVKLEFFDDGRLKSVNATNTGEGESIFKTILTIAGAVSMLGIESVTPAVKNDCARIKKWGGDKPLSLVYQGDIDFGMAIGTKQVIKADITSDYYASQLAPTIGGVCAFIEKITIPDAPLVYEKKTGDVLLKARQPATVEIKVMAGPKEECRKDEVWKGELLVAQLGKAYVIPIPKPPAFGKQFFAVTLADSGFLTSVEYLSNTGFGQALNVGNAALTTFRGETAAQKAAELKAEADIIAQQQRLVECRATPATCK